MPKRRAFMLIELLIVIAIIALLIGLTLPALKGAKAAGRQTGCLSDMHQMGIALATYVIDYRDSLPYPNWGPVAQVQGWLYGPGVITQTCSPTDRHSGSLWNYLNNDTVYRCPSHLPPYTGTANMTSYIMNGAAIGYGRAAAPYKVTQFDGGAVILWDGNEQVSNGPAYNDGSSFPYEIVPGHHGTNVTCMRADASSASFDQNTFYALRDATDRNIFWCNPGSANGH
jgi:type II secretory pathway pseudopilin PulG